LNIKLGSLFDGIGGFPYAGTLLGIEPVWASEIEPFPIRVTQQHFPNMKHLGDITKINGAKIEPVDVITFGSPCQDLSVAGKREGLAGARSGLFIEAVGLFEKCEQQQTDNIPDSQFGRMSPELSAVTAVKISGQSSKKSQRPKFQCLQVVNGQTPEWSELIQLTSLGESWTPNIGESPSVAVESSLSQILEANVPEKYFLSSRACEGILRRAEKRGKKLPPQLEIALRNQIV
jgi:hypothetical protein